MAAAVSALIRTYAVRAALVDLPPINLEGDRWDEPWEAIASAEPCDGQAGRGPASR